MQSSVEVRFPAVVSRITIVGTKLQERDEALAPDAEDLVADEGRHLSGVRDERAGEPGCKAAGFGRGQLPGDEGSSAERDSWFGSAYSYLTSHPAGGAAEHRLFRASTGVARAAGQGTGR